VSVIVVIVAQERGDLGEKRVSHDPRIVEDGATENLQAAGYHSWTTPDGGRREDTGLNRRGALQWHCTIVLTIAAAIAAGCTSGATPSTSGSPMPVTTVESLAPPEPTPTPTASASPSLAAVPTVPVDWTPYTSKRYRYSVDYPSDWTPTVAQQDWPSDGYSYPEDYAIDKWAPPTNVPTWVLMFVSSVPLMKGETPAARIARLDRDNNGVCSLANRRTVTVAGVDARQEDGVCFGADSITEIAVVKNGRFYLVYVLSGRPLTDVTLGTFDHFVKSFRILDS
jgi:hypothetical protein